MKTRNMIVLILAVITMTGAGCGRKQQEKVSDAAASKLASKIMEHATGEKTDVDISHSGSTINIKTRDGSMKVSGGDNVKLPGSFPKDIPVYSGAQIKASMEKDGEGFMVTMESDDAASAVVAFYFKKMEQAGWKKEESINMPGQNILSFSRNDNNVNIMIMTQDDKTLITISGSRDN